MAHDIFHAYFNPPTSQVGTLASPDSTGGAP
ncbi:MAG: hypothetical protein F4Z60_07405 [Chloroflexi bacterium]|nr:hypothetical protein [Chloroflexota bacterium]